jgi:hypothetical protein
MSYSIQRGVIAAVVFLGAAICLGAPPEKDNTESYQVTITSKLVVDESGKTSKIDADGVLKCKLHRGAKEATLSFDSLYAKLSVNDNETFKATMDKTKLSITQAGKTTEMAADKAPELVQQLLKDSFDGPLCKLTYDDAGKETKRDIVAGPGAKSVRESGDISNALLIQVPFPAKEDKWEVANEIGMGEGAVAKGKLTYEKGKVMGDQVVVKVSGVLTNDSAKRANGLTLKDARYTVSGEQMYDTAKHRWVSSDVTVDVAFKLDKDGKVNATTKGTMHWKLEALTDK